MSLIKSLLALTENPAGLRRFVEDPQAVQRLVGLGEAECEAIGRALKLALNLRSNLSGPRRTAPAGPAANARYGYTRNRGTTAGQQEVAITGIVGLLAVTGAVVAVGTVSMVALSRRRDE